MKRLTSLVAAVLGTVGMSAVLPITADRHATTERRVRKSTAFSLPYGKSEADKANIAAAQAKRDRRAARNLRAGL